MSEEHPSADLFKVTAALILFVIAVIGGLLPRRAQKVGSRLVSCLNTAAGGVFFASAMTHMLPESSETLEDTWGDSFPWGGFLCAFGFLLILCIDHGVSIINANRKKNGRGGHTLVPTEPPQADLSKGFGGAGKGSRHRNLDSDLEDIEMATISPHGLLSSSAVGHSEEPLVADGNGGGGGDRSTNGGGGGGNNGNGGAALSSGSLSYRRQDAAGGGGGGGGCNGNGGVSRGGDGAGGGDACPQKLISSPSHHDGDDHEDDDLHAHAHTHTHSHGLGDEEDGVWVRVALLLALSAHSIMEGLGVGAKSTKAYNLLFAIGVHKGLAAYALGASLLQSGVHGKQVTLFVLAFAGMTPLGILLGHLIEEDGEDDSAAAVCVALAAGTFLYVSLMEVLPPELASTRHGWSKMGSLLAGFLVSAGVGWIVG